MSIPFFIIIYLGPSGTQNFQNAGMLKIHYVRKKHQRQITTRNSFFTEGLSLCRGPNLGHSAKTFFAEGRQLRPWAKKSPRQRKALAKEFLCRGPRPSPKTPSALAKDVLGNFSVLSNGSRALSAFAEGHPSGPRQRF